MCYCLGADLSLNSSGLVILDKSANIVKQYLLTPPDGSRGVERLFFLEQSLIEFLDQNHILYCCIESPALGTEQGRLFDLGEWAGIFKLHLFKRNIEYLLIAPNQLKKYASGQGQSRKDTIMLDIYKNYNIEIRQNDLADAYILARICRDYQIYNTPNSSLELKKYQEEVLLSIRKKYQDINLLI